MEGMVILVDDSDRPVGTSEKLSAHRRGQLHRAFSVILFGESGVLLQQRARNKYHSASLWSNACCGHPNPGEDTRTSAGRRLREELGMASELREILLLQYRL
jgi:isopentenyl-diphosphate delta-isomerase